MTNVRKRPKTKPKANRKKTGMEIVDLGFITDITDTTMLEKELEDYISEYKMQEVNLDDEAILDHPIDEKTGVTTYSLATKKFALLLIETMVHHSGQYEGKPMYFRIGKILGVDPRQLYNWNTRDKEAIMSQVDTFDTAIKDYVKLKLNILMLKLLNEIGNRDLKEMYDKNLISLLNALYHKWRLEQGESTANVAVQHKIAFPIPKEE